MLRKPNGDSSDSLVFCSVGELKIQLEATTDYHQLASPQAS